MLLLWWDAKLLETGIDPLLDQNFRAILVTRSIYKIENVSCRFWITFVDCYGAIYLVSQRQKTALKRQFDSHVVSCKPMTNHIQSNNKTL